MKRLGISIYPEKSNTDELINYIDLAHKYNVKRVFSCLLSAPKDSETIESYKKVFKYCADKGMEVIVDVAPSVFKDFRISYNDLSFFKEIGATGFRLDEGFDGQKEASMTYNPFGLKVELNASLPGNYLDLIMGYQPAMGKLIMCHNFYPQKYSGLGLDLFNELNTNIKAKNLKIAAFVSSNSPESFGPWDVKEGLPTLEMHRFLPIDLQVRHLFATNQIDDVIISNCYPTEEEFKAINRLSFDKLEFGINLEQHVSEVEKEIIYEYDHYVRGDMSEYMARSTFPRIDYKEASIKEGNTRDLKRGDVVVLNDNYGRYKGELHICLKDMKNEGSKNVVGTIKESELFLLDYIEPWRKFGIIKEDV